MIKTLRFDRLFYEAVVVGLSALVVGVIVMYMLKAVWPNAVDVPILCKEWNRNHVAEITLFLTGFFLHIGYEAVGAN